MNRFSYELVLILSVLFISSSSYAAVLRWSPVESTESCIVSGYKVHYGTNSGQYTHIVDVGNNTSYNIDILNLIPTQIYYFAVSAYSTTQQDGTLSSPISYIDSPSVVEYPSIDYANNTIDITFTESNMQGAGIKGNYQFSPSLLFNNSHQITQSGRMYRLTMTTIPPNTIITVTINNVTDNQGNSLISNVITLNDNDQDGMGDDWESFYGISSALLDSDSDGLYNRLEFTTGTNPTDSDSDNDGMPDGWEVQNSLNPLVNDANGDTDGDGITNLEEYNEGTGISNKGPEKPVLNLPANSSTNIAFNPQLGTDSYVDVENDAHLKTHWQISLDQAFNTSANILYELETFDSLVRLSVPELILSPDKIYYWRVRFFDARNGRSLWSDPFSFRTNATDIQDTNGDGVPDIQQVTDGTIDLDQDGDLDLSSTTYKMVNNNSITYGLKALSNISVVECLKSINSDEISDSFGKPSNLDYGLIEFKIKVDNIGDTAEVRVYFSKPIGTTWYKYDLINGWKEYSKDFPENVQFSSDRFIFLETSISIISLAFCLSSTKTTLIFVF